MLSGHLRSGPGSWTKHEGVYSGRGKGWLSAVVPWGQLPRQVTHLGSCSWTSVLAASPSVRQG